MTELLLSWHCNLPFFDRVLTSDEKWVLYDITRYLGPYASHYKTTSISTQDHTLYLLDKSSSIMSCYQLVKPSLRTCNRSSWNLCNGHWSRSRHWLICTVPPWQCQTSYWVGGQVYHATWSRNTLPSTYIPGTGINKLPSLPFHRKLPSWKIFHKWSKPTAGIHRLLYVKDNKFL